MTTAVDSITRSRNEFTTPAALRQLLKSSLGYNARMVTVSQGHSLTWLTITIRDAAVDIAKVKAFAAPFNTSHVDETDYHTGQSVEVRTTEEVDAVHAAPHIEEIKGAVAKIVEGKCGCGTQLSNGKYLWKSNGDYYVTAQLNGSRGCYIWGFDVERGSESSIRALALQMARV